MGVYDRDYYRSHFRSPFGDWWSNLSICRWIIGINCVLFILQIISRSSGDLVTSWLILNPGKVIDGEIWRIITYSFIHSTDTPFHILMNMLALWMFGKEIEDVLGAKEFLLFYLTSVFIGGITFFLASIIGLHPPQAVCLGASGGVSAILILFACWFPNRTVLLFFIIPMPIWLLAILFVSFDAFNLLSGHQGSVAVDVHLSGALFAFMYHTFRWRLWPSKGLSKKLFSKKPVLKLYREEVPVFITQHEEKEGTVSEEMLYKVDQILEKISQSGQNSLSEAEKTFLFKASESIKKRKN
jgi:membrane associated rhomboid family serine protease